MPFYELILRDQAIQLSSPRIFSCHTFLFKDWQLTRVHHISARALNIDCNDGTQEVVGGENLQQLQFNHLQRWTIRDMEDNQLYSGYHEFATDLSTLV